MNHRPTTENLDEAHACGAIGKLIELEPFLEDIEIAVARLRSHHDGARKRLRRENEQRQRVAV